MALIAAGVGAVPVFQMGAADRVILVGLRNVTTGDTLDLGATGMNLLAVINRAVIISVTSFVEIAANWNAPGTVVTMPSGMANDAGYLLAWGSGIN
jgi:hypothetical protein